VISQIRKKQSISNLIQQLYDYGKLMFMDQELDMLRKNDVGQIPSSTECSHCLQSYNRC